MDNNTLTNYLKSQGKLHLKYCFSNLLENESFDQDLFTINLETLENQLQLFEEAALKQKPFSPYMESIQAGAESSRLIGIDAVKKGLGGCLLIAGGQGTRLGCLGPKGASLVTPIKQKSLFQFFAEKVKAASTFAKKDLPLAIMTSPLNKEETLRLFEENNFFGLKEGQVYIFSQTMLPLLDFEWRLIYDSKGSIAGGPDGNGSCFEAFFNSGIGDQWRSEGIEYLNIVLIDNPLADPYDFELFGHLINNQNDVILKSCLRKHPGEKVGVIVKSEGKVVVIEYNELPAGYYFEKEPSANLSMLALRMDFAKEMSSKTLPLHKAKKKAPYFDVSSNTLIEPKSPNVWKYEKYLFDILPYSKSTSVLLYPRSEIFSPLKNLEGEDSISSVQRDLLNQERKIFERITKRKAPDFPFEISPQFYYPTKELIDRWESQEANSPYLL